MILGAILISLLVLGFAHIIWVLSIKENAITKLIGQIIAIAIVVVVILHAIYGGMYGRKMGYGMNKMMKMCPMHDDSGKMMKMPMEKK